MLTQKDIIAVIELEIIDADHRSPALIRSVLTEWTPTALSVRTFIKFPTPLKPLKGQFSGSVVYLITAAPSIAFLCHCPDKSHWKVFFQD